MKGGFPSTSLQGLPGLLSHILSGVHLDTCNMEIFLPCASELEIVPLDLVFVLSERDERSESGSCQVPERLSGNSLRQWLPGSTVLSVQGLVDLRTRLCFFGYGEVSLSF